ncbi:SixA phosphatase family protein [Yoonia sp. 2307UL14-13]|uniref:SixA phosphatase family protein n=1 Tax=Yoonia sp. 2307UL14-13 TaxID=3126506 RepID=UPI0030AD072E
MTFRLILIRHAKSSWDDPTADDHDRLLNTRGCQSAKTVGAWMAERSYVPQVVLCSDAARTRETAALILPQLLPAPKLKLSAALYHAAPDTMLDLVSKQDAGTLAVIGHNPGIGILANALAGQMPDHPRFDDYPTCATTVMDFDIGAWRNVGPGKGRVVDFVVPQDLLK